MENTLHLALKLRSMLGTSKISDIEYELMTDTTIGDNEQIFVRKDTDRTDLQFPSQKQ